MWGFPHYNGLLVTPGPMGRSNNPLLVVTMTRRSRVTTSTQTEIQLGSDQLLGTIYDRRLKVASVLEDSASKPDWEAIRRDSTSVSQGASPPMTPSTTSGAPLSRFSCTLPTTWLT